VLLVEDDAADALLISEALAEAGGPRAVVRTDTGAAALAHLRDAAAELPDLILVDLNIPVLDGRELLATLTSDPAWVGIPVVVLTTSRNPADIETAYARHANAYVVKPFDLDAMTRAVREIDAFFFGTATLPAPAAPAQLGLLD
jgi:CheY-like chemotaxis protein